MPKDPMQKGAIVPLYLMMLAAHLAHVLEEVWGRFWLMNAFYGLGLPLTSALWREVRRTGRG